MENPRLIISAQERELLNAWIVGYNPPDVRVRESLDQLYAELEQAEVRPENEIPADVVRLHSIVDIRTPFGRREGLQLVMPADADLKVNRLSVMSVMGAALIGYREGATIRWQMPQGAQDITLERVDNTHCNDIRIPMRNGK
ncbi:MAG TPA: GreA/GreB family elongation factor [Flavobacteriales bacterium]|nr:GreA/GreB family elongation factor [Flavobacteriales bacterium]